VYQRLNNVISELRSVGRFYGGPRLRSRFIKTQIRNVVEGDFLFLDADTVAVSRFDGLIESDAPITAALDRSPVDPPGAFPKWVTPDFIRLGWRHPTRFYLNSGVVFWKDCEQARALGRLWHEKWLVYTTSVDNPADQPAFNYSLDMAGIEPKIVEEMFNARVGITPDLSKAPCIYHLLSGESKPKGTFMDELLIKYRKSGRVDFSLIDDVVKRGHPWMASERDLEHKPPHDHAPQDERA
jgi:hypothetical protein